MKKTSKISIVFSLVLISLFSLSLGWYGYFSDIKPSKKPVGPYLLVYKTHHGSVSVADDVSKKIEQDLRSIFGLKDIVRFGLYYDDPKTVNSEDCRSLVGCILQDNNEGDLQEISKKYVVANFPRGMAVVVDYPYKNNLSAKFGFLKVYPAFADYFHLNSVKEPVLAVFDVERQRIRYVMSTDYDGEFLSNFLSLKPETNN